MPRSSRPTDVILQPGEFAVGQGTCRLRTMLGSCVAITLWHPLRRVGAMSHFLLANRGSQSPDKNLDARYGDEALALMLQKLSALQVDGAACVAKIFGGANMFQRDIAAAGPAVGRRNGEAARQLLALHGIAVQGEHLFGEGHRQIVFDIACGSVWVRQVPPELMRARHKGVPHSLQGTLGAPETRPAPLGTGVDHPGQNATPWPRKARA